jgi:putative inorganic carbon (HCO3(-)) transporter
MDLIRPAAFAGKLALAAAGAMATALALLLAADAGAAWIGLVVIAPLAIAVVLWSADAKMLLLQVALVTMTIDISKSVVPLAERYAPGLTVSLSDFFVAGYVLLWALEKVLVRGEPAGTHPLVKLGFVYTCFLWLSAAWADYPLGTAMFAISHTKYFVLFAVVANDVRSMRQLHAVLYALGVALALNVVMALLQCAAGAPLMLQGAKISTVGTELVFGESGVTAFRPGGFMQHPLALAGFLIFVLPALFALALLGRKVLGRGLWAALGLLAGGLAALVLTLSRGGWMSLAVAAAFVVVMMLRARLIRLRHVALLAAGLVALLGLAAAIYPSSVQRLYAEDANSTESRRILMDQAMLLVHADPVLGVGLAGYREAARNAIPESLARLHAEQRRALSQGLVHNKYVLVAAETGLVGLALFCYLIWRTLKIFLRMHGWRGPEQYALGVGITGGLLAQAVFYLFDHFYLDVRIQLFWLGAALLVALNRLQRGSRADLHGIGRALIIRAPA